MTPEAAKYLKIPQELLRDRRLTFGEMCHLCLIAQLQNAKGCTATNQYFGDYFDIKRNNSARTISALKRKGFIHAVEVKSGGKTIERTITIIEPDSIKLLLTESNKGIKKIPSNGIKSCNGLVSERDTIHKKRHKSTHKNIFDATSASMEISRLLFSFIQQRDSKVKEPDFQKWAVHIDRLTRLDDRTPEQIEAVIRWCQADSFWRTNILSTEKLRKQFSMLYQKMNEAKNGKSGKSKLPTKDFASQKSERTDFYIEV